MLLSCIFTHHPVLQFAYNEMSFFMIRLLQSFSSMELDLTAQPPEARPPVEWREPPEHRRAAEQIRPKSHFTLYVEVSVGICQVCLLAELMMFAILGWVVG